MPTQLLSQSFDLEDEIRDYAAMRDVVYPHRAALRAGPGLEVKCSFTPAADGVAGDFYAVTPGPDEDSTILAVGDVSGKGAEAARRATFVRTALATFAGFVDEPCQLLELSNQVLVERAGPSTIFVTAVVTVLRPREGRLTRASAGSPAAAAARQRRAAAQRPQARAAPRHRSHDHLRAGGDGDRTLRRGTAVHRRPHRGAPIASRAVRRAAADRGGAGERGRASGRACAAARGGRARPLGGVARRRSAHRCCPRGDRSTQTFQPPPFGIEVTRDAASATIAILGELDISTTPELTEALGSLEPGYETLVVDLSRCTVLRVERHLHPAGGEPPREGGGLRAGSDQGAGRGAAHVRPRGPRPQAHVPGIRSAPDDGVDHDRAARPRDRDAVVAVADRVGVADRDHRDRRQHRAAMLGQPQPLPAVARDRERAGSRDRRRAAPCSARACCGSRPAGSRGGPEGAAGRGRRSRRSSS